MSDSMQKWHKPICLPEDPNSRDVFTAGCQ